MTIEQLQKILIAINGAYGDNQFPITKNRVEIYYDVFKNYDAKDLWFGMKAHITTNRYAPTIADLVAATKPYREKE